MYHSISSAPVAQVGVAPPTASCGRVSCGGVGEAVHDLSRVFTRLMRTVTVLDRAFPGWPPLRLACAARYLVGDMRSNERRREGRLERQRDDSDRAVRRERQGRPPYEAKCKLMRVRALTGKGCSRGEQLETR